MTGHRHSWPGALSRLIAHELGHYLGLVHVVDASGTPDHRRDTGPDNFMPPTPTTASGCALTPAQAHVVRQHLSVVRR